MPDRASLSTLFNVFLSTTTLSILLLLVERWRMQALLVPETVSLVGFNVLVSAFSNLDTLIVAILVVVLAALALGIGIVGAVLLVLAVIFCVAALLATIILAMFLFGLNARVFAIGAEASATRLINALAREEKLRLDEVGLKTQRDEISRRKDHAFGTFRAGVVAVWARSLSAAGSVLAVALWTFQVLFLVASIAPTPDADPEELSQHNRRAFRLSLGRNLALLLMLALVMMTLASWNFFRERALRGVVGEPMTEVHWLAEPGLNLIEALAECRPAREPWQCSWALAPDHYRFPLVELSVSRSVGQDVAQLAVAAGSGETLGSFRTAPYYYLGDFGDWAFLADYTDPARRILLKRSAIVEISEVVSGVVSVAGSNDDPRHENPDQRQSSDNGQAARDPIFIVVPPARVVVDAPDLSPLLEEFGAARLRWETDREALLARLDTIAAAISAHEPEISAQRSIHILPNLLPRMFTWDLDLSVTQTTPPDSTLAGLFSPIRQPSAAYVRRCLAQGHPSLAEVSFAENSAALAGAGSALASVFALLEARRETDPPLTLLLVGTASATGHPLANLVMSETRAEAVARALMEQTMGDAGGDPVLAAGAFRSRFGVTLLAYGMGEHPDAHHESPRSVKVYACAGEVPVEALFAASDVPGAEN